MNDNNNNNKNEVTTRSGFVALIGRPNVGKSTLLNALIGKKISITANKPQTTRYKILGVQTRYNTQVIYVDTPGMHSSENRKMNQALNSAANSAVHDVDLILWLIACSEWTEDDDLVLKRLQNVKTPVVLIVNKIDKIKQKEKLLPYLQQLALKFNFAAIIPISALQDPNFNNLHKVVDNHLVEGPFYFDKDQTSNMNLKFQLAEALREKLVRVLHSELPYAVSVIIEDLKFITEKNQHKVQAVIWVERESQKAIVIGKKGENLKTMATMARLEMEEILSTKVFLSVLVKVKDNWSESKRDLLNLGIIDS